MTEMEAGILQDGLFERPEMDALVERIYRLQVLVVELLKKNEDLRQKLILGLDS